MNDVQILFNKLGACKPAKEWSASQVDLESAWNNCEKSDWMIWLIRKLNFVDIKFYKKYACFCARQNWNKLGNASKNAIEVAESYIDGNTTIEELQIARKSAYDAADAAYAAADAAYAAADAAYDAADAAYAAYAAADAAAYAYATYAAADAAYRVNQCNYIRQQISFADIKKEIIK